MLTILAVKKASPRQKDYKVGDGQGMYLLVSPTGHKSWRLKYRFAGKERRLILGSFPDMSLADARIAREDARRMIREGKDPGLDKQRRKVLSKMPPTDTFEEVAREWYALKEPRWRPVHAADVITSLERDIFPFLGRHGIADLDAALIHAVLKKVEKRGAIETAHRLRQRVSQVFVYAEAKMLVTSNPASKLGILMKPVPVSRRRPAFVTLPALHDFMRTIEHAGASPSTKLSSRFLGLTAQRPGMVRRMRWRQIEGVDWSSSDGDVSEAIWRVPAQEMKQEFDLREQEAFEHKVPLAPAAVAVLRVQKTLAGRSGYVFPSMRTGREPMSSQTWSEFYNRLGYQHRHCPHGWRSAFSTIMNGRLGGSPKFAAARDFYRLVIDLMLAHLPKGVSETERIYNRAAYMEERREIATEWATALLENFVEPSALLEGPYRRYEE